MKTIVILFLGLSSCIFMQQNRSNSSTSDKVNSQDLAQFEKAFTDMAEGRYYRARTVFEKLAKQYSGHELKWAALYNLAGLHKKLGECDKAKTLYHQLIQQEHTRVKAHSYLLLSYIYECLGDVDKTLEVLKAAQPYIYLLPEEKHLIEYPARLALAYIRIGEEKTGLDIQKQVHQNMEKIRKTSPIHSVIEENFARYLYLMGESHIQPDKIQLKKFLKIAIHYQFYLTQSLLLESGEWSIHAERQLGMLYRKIWGQLKKEKDKPLYAESVYRLLNNLKRISEHGKNKRLRVIYETLNKKTYQVMNADNSKK